MHAPPEGAGDDDGDDAGVPAEGEGGGPAADGDAGVAADDTDDTDIAADADAGSDVDGDTAGDVAAESEDAEVDDDSDEAAEPSSPEATMEAAEAAAALVDPEQTAADREERESHFVGDAQDARSTTTASDLPALDDVSSEALVDLATYDLTFDITPYAWIRVDGLLQLRWAGNYRDQPTSGQNYTNSFTIPRARFAVWAGVTEYLRFRMRFGVSSGGETNLEQAFADAAFGPFTLRVGRFWLPIYWGGGPPPNFLTKTEYSFTANYLDGGQTQGAGLTWGTDYVRLRAYVGDGLRTGFAEFAQQGGADYALTARFDARWFTSHEWSRFDEFSSFRGSDDALRFGGAVHVQQGGQTGTTDNLDYVITTADVQLEGDGYHLFAAGGWAHVNVAGAVNYDNFALEVQAGYFVLEPLEMWAAYDALFADGKAQPAGLGGGTGETDLHTLSAGLTWYIVPRAHRAKLTAQLDYVIGALDTSLIGPSNNNALLPTTGGNQFIARLQLMTAF